MSNCLSLKKSNCKNCYKCIRHCSVKSIRFSDNQAHVNGEDCILCGQCFVVCPQGAKEIVSEVEKVKSLIASNRPVVACLAPSFVANYDGIGINAMRTALKQLGFFAVEETAIGATIVKNEYERILNEEKPDVLISSCCHSVNLLIQKYFPNQIKHLAKVLSPMQAHSLDVKKRIKDAYTVFIGPCVAKKDEAEKNLGIIDAVLTFEDLTNWLQCDKITLHSEKEDTECGIARFFPTAGGVLKTMKKSDEYQYLAIDGAENCISALKDIENGVFSKCFIEMNVCAGGCIGGPVMEKYHRSPVKDYLSVANYVGKRDFQVDQPSGEDLKKQFVSLKVERQDFSESEIISTLKQMGKTKLEDQLNCGTCGYNTCREKAVAVLQGKAEISMCLPFLKEKAESFSNNIVNNTPNGIIVLNDKLEVQQINNSAQKILNVRYKSDILGEQVVRVLDPLDFLHVLQTKESIRNKQVYLVEYGKYVEESIIYDVDYNVLICIMRDVTEEQNSRKQKEKLSRKTVEVADNVVEKQMRIVQEIASLLGETAAETKIALTKLKESLTDE